MSTVNNVIDISFIAHLYGFQIYYLRGFPGGSLGKESSCNVGDPDSIPESGRCPGGGHVNPFQYSSVENSQGQRSLASCSPWGRKESDTTEQLSTTHIFQAGLSRWLSGKGPTCQAGEAGLIPGSERYAGGGNGNPLQYSCLGNPMDRGAWWATVWGITKESDRT